MAYSGVGRAFPVLVQIIMIIMMFLITIIIGNLITGLTVNNLRCYFQENLLTEYLSPSQLYKQSDIYKLGKTVQQILSVEKTVSLFFKT